jgi:hypothetical protein
MDGKLHWEYSRKLAWPEEDEAFVLRLSHFSGNAEERAFRELAICLDKNGIQWLIRRNRRWYLDLDKMRRFAPAATDFAWLHGVVEVSPRITVDEGESNEYVLIELTEEFMNENAPQRIFLSHKGTDKTLVRAYHRILTELGFQPWLDEEAMAAGVNLERALMQGMRDSCAAVFFVTTNYKDEGYLATEIDYAVREKRRKGDRFAIITLVLGEGRIEVPGMLETYVWKTPQTEFDALRDIIRGLPIRIPTPEWRY